MPRDARNLNLSLQNAVTCLGGFQIPRVSPLDLVNLDSPYTLHHLKLIICYVCKLRGIHPMPMYHIEEYLIGPWYLHFCPNSTLPFLHFSMPGTVCGHMWIYSASNI